MKKLLFVVSALAAISLLAPSSGFAQWENRIGVYTETDALGTAEAQMDLEPSTLAYVYFVLTVPRNNGVPVTNIEGFECTVNVEPLATFFKLGETYNSTNGAQALNVSSYPEYVVGWTLPVPVIGDQIMLMRWNVMLNAADAYYVYLTMASNPSIPGALVYQDADGTSGSVERPLLVGAMPSSGAFDVPSFAFNDVTIPEKQESFGTVKALFR